VWSIQLQYTVHSEGEGGRDMGRDRGCEGRKDGRKEGVVGDGEEEET
jgi:hypothetical protein